MFKILKNKKCSKCKKTKRIKNFSFRSEGKYKDGYHPYCKQCKRKISKQWRKANPNRSKQWRKENPNRSKQWRKENPNYSKKWHAKHKEEIDEYSKNWYKENKKRLNRYRRKKHRNNPHLYDKTRAKYAKKNKKKILTRAKKYRDIPKNKIRVKKQTRKWYLKIRSTRKFRLEYRYSQYKAHAKRKGIPFKLTFKQFCKLLKRICSYCGCKEHIGIDRIDNNKGYTIKNCVPCRTTCNMMKASLDKKEFINHCKKISNKQFNTKYKVKKGISVICKKSTINARYLNYVSNARKRRIKFGLNKRQFWGFENKSCCYCRDDIIGIGIDRINNNKPYTIKNSCSCCKICNPMKKQMSKTKFINQCKKIAEYHTK